MLVCQYQRKVLSNRDFIKKRWNLLGEIPSRLQTSRQDISVTSRINTSFRPRKARLSPELLLLQYERDQNFHPGRSKQIAAKYHQIIYIK